MYNLKAEVIQQKRKIVRYILLPVLLHILSLALLTSKSFGEIDMEPSLDMQLSKHFTLYEFVCSLTAEKCEIENMPNMREIRNMKYLCEAILEPIRTQFGGKQIKITSGYRNPELNEAVGGSPTSDHMCRGRNAAADIVIAGIPTEIVFKYIRQSKLPFKQVINEFGIWVHVSAERPKREVYRTSRIDGETTFNKLEGGK